MADITYENKNRRIYLDWIPEILFYPRRAFSKISSAQNAVWLTPLIVISCLVLINILVVGKVKNQIAQSGEITYPPDYQYYTPEQQAQYNQAIQSTQGPVFVYVLPAITALVGVWLGWLILGGVLHLITTLFGGRSSTIFSMNIAAWGSLPLSIRALVQVIYILATNKLISSPGLSGFMPTGESNWLIFLSHLMRLIDIYIIWQIILLILGVRKTTKLNPAKSAIGVFLAILVIVLLQAGIAYAGSMLSNLSITRPFLF